MRYVHDARLAIKKIVVELSKHFSRTASINGRYPRDTCQRALYERGGAFRNDILVIVSFFVLSPVQFQESLFVYYDSKSAGSLLHYTTQKQQKWPTRILDVTAEQSS